ncbi:caspase family protein [Citreicella sp. C3M06]|uniref:caspase family protein n=1 Tax=Citreicella sp. C3M06 TaxID=2841564 RepID=UPI001C08E86F|nr:caspase family protein [Citreicella sp. C3M06]MBU2959876.1 caspase family protein [Citreicella sp. C3M06]
MAICRWLMMVAVVALCASGARAETRIALVVGNSNYVAVTPLPNPASDARLVAATLRSLGFEVQELIDSDRTALVRGISQFGRSLRQAGPEATGLFYYAGHGVQSFGSNYLLPVSVQLQDAADLDLVAVEVQSVLRQMSSAGNRTNIMILDACRNNPFSAIPAFGDNGLAEMKAPTGTFLAYATAPGSVALDGAAGNSPFTAAVARLMPTPGLAIEQMFKQVRVEVIRATGGAQTPWDSSSLTSNFAFSEAEKLSSRDLEARQFWESIKDTRDAVQIMLFLRGYGDTVFAEEARTLLTDVIAQELAGEAAPASATPAGPSSEEQRLFDAAQAQGSIAGWQRYLEGYPDGTFAEYASGEVAALSAAAGNDPDGAGAPGPAPEVIAAAPAPAPDVPPTFRGLLVSPEPAVNGRSIADLINSTPLFPPIEGLPDDYWKGQKCSNCHDWTEDRICVQAQTYVSSDKALDKKHPLGGSFKAALRDWAAAGCP